MEKTQQFLKETEAAAQDVLITKQDIIAMDQRRQKVREALWALKKDEKQKPDGKTWLSIGSLFVKTRTDKSKNLLERDLKELDREIDQNREKLKGQVMKTRDLEGLTDLRGFDLKPLTKEAQAITKATISR